MSVLTGTHIRLRALEPEDLTLLALIENNTANWEISHTQTPYSKYVLKQYLKQTHQDIYEAKQLRLVIEDKENNALGLIDLFDFNPQHKRAGIGIIILDEHQNKGIASDALEVLIRYCFTTLQLHQLYANILADNQHSIRLFEKLGFTKVGTKKDWLISNNTFKDELLFQLINA